jgi:hypothetical protein
VPATVGVPLMVTTLTATVAVTPAGKPVTVAPVAPPPKVMVMLVIALLIQTVAGLAAVIVWSGFTVIVELVVAGIQLFPVVVTVKLNVPATVGVPLMVNVFPTTLAVTPAGKPVTVAPVAPPPKVMVMLVIALLIQTVAGLAAVIVWSGFIVIVEFVVAGIQLFPVVVTVKLNVPATVGVPLMVTTFPTTLAVTPAGKPVTVAPVAPPPKVMVMLVIALLIQTVTGLAAVMVWSGLTVIVELVVAGIQLFPVVVTV